VRRSVVAFVVISIAAVLLLPLGFIDGTDQAGQDSPADRSEFSVDVQSISFLPALNTSRSVPEYSMVSRALMLPGGSTYSALADINRDGRTDLIVAVSEARIVSIFYRQSDNNLLSYPSANISLDRTPIGVLAVDSFAAGISQIAVVERRNDDLDAERLLIYNYTSDTTPYLESKNLSLYKTASSFAVGYLDSDLYPDFAFACPGLIPSVSSGVVEIRFGPDFTTSVLFSAGRGSYSIAVGNFSNDSLQDLAISNYYDQNIHVFFQPFSFGNAPNYTLSTSTSNPIALTSGDLSNDGSDDIAVVAENPSRLLFYFQSIFNLQTFPDSTYSRVLVNETASSVFCSDVNSDGRNDLLMLSVAQNRVFGLFQRSSGSVWPLSYDFVFPTGSNPRHALVGKLDSDSMTDIAVSSARADWSGSSIAIYPARTPVTPAFSNANATIWGNVDWESSAFGVGDLDGDGLCDVAATYPSGQMLGLIKVPGGSEYDTALGFTPAQMIVFDLNGDGLADVLVSQALSGNLSLYFGQSDLTAPLTHAQITCGANVTDFAVGLLNDDNLTDIVAVTENGTLDIFFNTGSVTDPFQNVFEISPAPGVSIPAVAVGDFNSDGKDDIAYSLPNLEINVSFQKETSPFFSAQADTVLFHSTGGIFSELWSGDVNGDYRTDIAAMKAADANVFFFDQDDFMAPRTPYSMLTLPEVPKFVSLTDLTDDGHADIVATFGSADLLFLYKQSAGAIPALPSMVFVTGASPNYVVVGTLGQDEDQSMIVSDSESHSFSVWRQINLPPVVSIAISSIGPFYEFDQVNFTAIVSSYHPARLFEWQFEYSSGGPFVPDVTSTSTNNISHVYGHEGRFTIEVRVTVSDNSSAFGQIDVSVEDVVPVGTFDDFVTWERNAANTSQIAFDASALAVKYPDIAQTSWVFGDGTIQQAFGGPVNVITHYYVPGMDYEFVLNVTDDEWNTLTLTKTLKLNAPVILPTSPANGSIIKAGVPIKFYMSDDSLPLSWVQYIVNSGQPSNFTGEWEIGTNGWTDGSYSLEVKAADRDGNIAIKNNFTIVIDSLPPALNVLWNVKSVHGGDTVNISVQVTDPHVDDDSILLHVKLPGSKSYSQVFMNNAGNGVYYAIIEVPKRSGTLLFNVSAEDLAQNSVFSNMYSVNVKLHFIDAAWPFLLVLAVLAALGTAGYFFREVKIAVDETFVIYNDGRLIAHSTRHLKPGMDDQVLSGMFVAIQDFVRDSFKDITSFTLRKLEFGEKSVLIEKGDHLFLAVILHGKASKKVATKMQRIVDEIEEVFSPKLKDWDGDLDALRGVGDIAKKLYSKAPLLPPFRKQNT
jgi:hypothetical protein